MEYDELESTLDRLNKLLPEGVTLPNATRALEEAYDRIAPDFESDEDNYRDIDFDPGDSPAAIDREIDRLMDALLAR